MAPPVRPTLQAIVEQSLRATGADSGWLAAVVDDRLTIVAAGGLAADADAERQLIGHAPAAPSATLRYVLASGQPSTRNPAETDGADAGAGGFPGVPASILALPCGEGAGVLELAAGPDGPSFSFTHLDQLEPLLAVATAALDELDLTPEVATPAQLGAELGRLAEIDPGRYARTARLIEAVLGQGA